MVELGGQKTCVSCRSRKVRTISGWPRKERPHAVPAGLNLDVEHQFQVGVHHYKIVPGVQPH
jgi:hypothetical protein